MWLFIIIFTLGDKKIKKKELERVVRRPGLRGYGHVYMYYLMWLGFYFFSIHCSHWKGLGIITLIKTQTTKRLCNFQKKSQQKIIDFSMFSTSDTKTNYIFIWMCT